MQSQLNPWLQYPQGGFWLNFWQNGRIGINHAGTDSTGQPLMLLHSFRTISPEPVCYPATLTMQTENCEDPSNLFGQNSIDFWSNHYDSTYKWQTARIATYTNEEGPFDTLFNYYGGLKFASSGGPTRQGAEYGKIILEQNIPNPFDGVTEINCFIPEKYGKNIKLIITDDTGLKEIIKFDLKAGIENIIMKFPQKIGL